MFRRSVSRRTLHFNSIAEIRAEIDRLADTEVVTVGNWSFAQILDHLTNSMTACFDGFNFQAPWIIRNTAGRLLKKRFLTKPMPAGFKLPKRGRQLLPEDQPDFAEALTRVRTALDRFEHEEPSKPHPVLGALTPEQSVQLNCRHAELHLSFVVPVTE